MNMVKQQKFMTTKGHHLPGYRGHLSSHSSAHTHTSPFSAALDQQCDKDVINIFSPSSVERADGEGEKLFNEFIN